MNSGFSLIICTHNPDREVFSRLLDAIASLQIPTGVESEVIIIDNASNPPLGVCEYIDHWRNSLTQINVLIEVEKEPGLTNARLAGIAKAQYEWLVFFDDDNEPDSDYLLQLFKLAQNYPNVGAWGPGNVSVNYLGESIPSWFYNKKELFQHRQEASIIFDNKQEWQNCYPFGTGLCVKASLAKAYALEVYSQNFTLLDRRGSSLSSGGDTQLVLTCIKNGYSAGVAGLLKLGHNIISKKLNINYIIKQVYSTSSYYLLAYNEVFKTKRIESPNHSNLFIIKVIYSTLRIYAFKVHPYDLRILLAKRLGEINSGFMANNSRSPLVLKLYESIINV